MEKAYTQTSKPKMHLLFKIGLVIFVLPFLGLCYFDHPAADDYCNMVAVVENGCWGAMIFWYHNWLGRFSSIALATLYATFLDFFVAIKLIAFFVLVGLFLGLYCLSRILLRGLLAEDEIFWLAFLVFDLYLSSMPTVREGVYWASSTLSHQTGVIFTLFLLSALITYNPSHRTGRKFFHILVICLLTVAAAGCSETSLMVVFAGLAAGSLVTMIWDRARAPIWILAFLFCIAAAAVVILAPGNAARTQLYPLRFQLGLSLVKTVLFSVYILLTSWQSLPLLVAAGVIFAFPALRVERNIDISPNQFALRLLLWVGLFLASIFPAFYSTGGRPPLRVVNVSWAIFLIGWTINVFSFVVFAKRTLRKVLPLPPKLFNGAQIVVFIMLFSVGNFPVVAKDLISGASTYDRELADRYATLKAASASKNTDVEVRRLSVMPQSLIHPKSELQEDPDDWLNKCWAQYFGLKSIWLQRR